MTSKQNPETEAADSEAHQQEDGRPEPFATILELLSQHSTGAVLAAISDAALLESEAKEICSSCRMEAGWLHLELEMLLDRMDELANATKPEISDLAQ